MPVTLDMSPLDRFAVKIERGLQGGAMAGPVRKGLMLWGAIYREWVRERFVTFSRGGGDWAELKPATVARRRKGKKRTATFKRGGRRMRIKTGGPAILRDTSTLFAGTDPTLNRHGPFLEARQSPAGTLSTVDAASASMSCFSVSNCSGVSIPSAITCMPKSRASITMVRTTSVFSP